MFLRNNELGQRLTPFIVKELLVHLAGRCSNRFGKSQGRDRDSSLRDSATTAGQGMLDQI